MLNCLIVEDSPLNSMIMEKQASNLGLRVETCVNGVKALAYCREKRLPDLILLDGYMPEMDGLNFLRHLRGLPKGHEPYVVFCSSSQSREDVGLALDEGAECHFPKPISRDQIVYAIRKAQQRSAAFY